MGPKDLLQEHLKPVNECMGLLLQAEDAVVLDIETTGFSPTKHAEIIEIGAIRIDLKKGEPIDKYHKLIKPTNGRIPASITQVTNITAEMVQHAGYFEQVLPDFYDYIGDSLVVAHNASFDWFRFLQEYMLRVGRIATNDVVCTMALSKDLHPTLTKHSLAELCDYYGNSIHGHHRAFTDAKYTASICLRMRDEIEAVCPIDGLAIHTPHNLPPSSVGYADVTRMQLKSARLYQYRDKRLGRAIFFTTNLGSIYYHINRDCWGVQRQYIPQNIDLEAVKEELLKRFGVSNAYQLEEKAS